MGLLDKLKKKDKVKEEVAKKSTVVNVTKKDKEVAKDHPKKTESKEITKKSVKKLNSSGSTSHRVLIKPLVSEKTAISEQMGTYAFVVDKKANKFQVKEAIKEAYGILPIKVRIINVEGKRTNFGRQSGKRQDWKKAFVKMPAGKTINIHEGV